MHTLVSALWFLPKPMTSGFNRTLALIALAPSLPAAQGKTAAAQSARITLDSVWAPAGGSIVRTELTRQELTQPQTATIVLTLRNRAELEARVQRGEIISPSEMAARYYPTRESWAAVAGWASAQDLAVEPEDCTHMSVTFRGRVAQVADALQTRFARVRGDDGRQYTSAISAPSIPAAIAATVAGILRLQPQFKARAATLYKPTAEGGYGPQYVLDQYGATGVGDGSGQTIAVFGFDSPPNTTDLTTYWSRIGSAHTMADVTIINPNGYPAFDDQFVTIDTTPGAEVTIADPLIVGFVTTGARSKSVLVRGDGPALAGFGITDFLPDPQLELYSTGTSPLATLDSWTPSLDPIFTKVGAFGLTAGSHDAAALESLVPGAYTAEITSQALNYGVTLAEVYDADNGAPANRLTNVSARGIVYSGANILIAGFVIGGSTPLTVVIRGDGPALSLFSLGGLQNPQLTLYNASGGLIASNVGWGNAPVPGGAAGTIALQSFTDAIGTKVGAFALQDGSDDSAIVATLPPGAYTAKVTSGPPFSTINFGGLALLEIYELR
jgi:hypothetical protein